MRGSNVTNDSDLMHRLYINNVYFWELCVRRGELGGRNLLKLFLLDAVWRFVVEGKGTFGAHVAARVHSWGNVLW